MSASGWGSFEIIGNVLWLSLAIVALAYIPLNFQTHPAVLWAGLCYYLIWFTLATTSCDSWFGDHVTGLGCNEQPYGSLFYSLFYAMAMMGLGSLSGMILIESQSGLKMDATAELRDAFAHTLRKLRGRDTSKMGIFTEHELGLCHQLKLAGSCTDRVGVVWNWLQKKFTLAYHVFYPEPQEMIVIPLRLVVAIGCQLLAFIFLLIGWSHRLSPWKDGSWLYNATHPSSKYYSLASCSMLIALAGGDGWCNGDLTYNPGSTNQACFCEDEDTYSDNAKDSVKVAYAVPFVIGICLGIWTVAANIRAYRLLVLKIRTNQVAYDRMKPLVSSMYLTGYLMSNIVVLFLVLNGVLGLAIFVLGWNTSRNFVWDNFKGAILSVGGFKIFDIFIQNFVVGRVLTDGDHLKGPHDGWRYSAYSVISFVYMFFSVISGATNALVRVGMLVAISFLAPLFPGECLYPSNARSLDSGTYSND